MVDRPQPGSPERPPLSPELIEKLRQTGIRLDRQGRWWHEGATITHPGLCRALFRWLDRLPDGRPIVRLDEHRYAYVEVEDAPLLVTSARWHGDRAFLTLNDGTEQELDYASVTVAPDHALYCTVRNGTLEARVTTPAYYILAERIEPADSGGANHSDEPNYALHARGRVFLIQPR